MSNFSFSHIVFKRLVLQIHENLGLFGKGLHILQSKFDFVVLEIVKFYHLAKF